MDKIISVNKPSGKQIGHIVLSMIINYVFTMLLVWIGFVNEKTSVHLIISYASLVAILMIVEGFYLYFSDVQAVLSHRKIYAISAVSIISLLTIILLANVFGYYIAPYALCAMCVALLVGVKSGFFSNLIVVLCYFLACATFKQAELSDTLYIVICGLVSGVLAAFVASKQKQRLHYLLVSLYLSIAAIACCVACVFVTSPSQITDYSVVFRHILYSAISGLITVALFFVLVPLMEKIFNLVTDFRLQELTSTSHPLLQKLFAIAPGTFNHSLVVANYAEACATAIGENVFLAKAAGYYHDIGKIRNPQYYKENQQDGTNVHEDLTPELSVSFLKQHAIKGLVIAREYGLPSEIQQAIMQHHGTMLIKYFYHKAQKYTEEVLPYNNYCYDGPRPTSKISAILMIVDASEAALRSLGVSNKYKANDLVKEIIDERLVMGQFNTCDITMKELEIIQKTIVTSYLGISHERIKYPEVKIEKKIEKSEEKNEN